MWSRQRQSHDCVSNAARRGLRRHWERFDFVERSVPFSRIVEPFPRILRRVAAGLSATILRQRIFPADMPINIRPKICSPDDIAAAVAIGADVTSITTMRFARVCFQRIST
jgi:hypothetical protein